MAILGVVHTPSDRHGDVRIQGRCLLRIEHRCWDPKLSGPVGQLCLLLETMVALAEHQQTTRGKRTVNPLVLPLAIKFAGC